MHKTFLKTGAALAALGVILGAFGAHGLKKIVPPESVTTFETGVRYHMYHSFALLFAGILYEKFKTKWISYAGFGFITGIILFSGSLYAMVLMNATGQVGLGGLGFLTPVGGLFFIYGWIALFIAFFKGGSSLRSS